MLNFVLMRSAFCRGVVITITFLDTRLHHYGKLMLHEIKVLEINVNLAENNFQIKEMTLKER